MKIIGHIEFNLYSTMNITFVILAYNRCGTIIATHYQCREKWLFTFAKCTKSKISVKCSSYSWKIFENWINHFEKLTKMLVILILLFCFILHRTKNKTWRSRSEWEWPFPAKFNFSCAITISLFFFKNPALHTSESSNSLERNYNCRNKIGISTPHRCRIMA